MIDKRVVSNASWIIGCKIAQSGFALVINALTARYFGPSNFGLINYAASLVAFVVPLMSLGINEILVNELIKTPEREGEILGTSIGLTFLSSVLCIVGLLSFCRITDSRDTATLIVVGLYSLSLLAQSLELIQYWFHAKYLVKYVSIISFLAYLIISAYKFYLLTSRKSINWFAISTALDYLLIAIALLLVYKTKNGQRLWFSFTCAKKLLAEGKHYILPGVMGMVLAQSDKMMLRWMCDDVSVGYYSAALAISGLSSFVFSALITSFRPMILERKQSSQEAFRSGMAELYGIVIYLALFQSVILVCFAELIVQIMYGAAYYQTVPILQVVVWYTTFSYIGGVRTVWILAENKQRYLWIISFCGMILNIGLNAVLIPQSQALGAAIATLVTQIFTNIIMVCAIRPLRENIYLIFMGMNIKKIYNRTLR